MTQLKFLSAKSCDQSQFCILFQGSVSSDIDLESTVKLTNEYFSTEFLLSFPEPGLHTAKIVCYMLDCNDIKWDINCNAEIVVKSYKEKKHSSLMKSTIWLDFLSSRDRKSVV